MRTEITLLRRMIFWIDENSVVRTRRHTGFATDANRFIEIDNAIRALEHSRGRARYDAGCMSALVTTGYLMRTPRLWKNTYINVLDVGTRHGKRHQVFGFTGSRTRVTPDASGVIDNLGPFHRAGLRLSGHLDSELVLSERKLYHASYRLGLLTNVMRHTKLQVAIVVNCSEVIK